ncbi:hypothetical protein [Desulfovibrio inopinatus]|uniref:hypothetical protein n=1 Tax=Desulfovibrio inopinatus TaxID=102109 RepID=UPI000686F067|nr:hypothetical protein [Desulfovibrio inopinatus]
MSFLVPIAMFGWIPFVLYLFARFKGQRAVIAAFILAWLFLPVASYGLSGLPDYTKMFATCIGVLLAAATYESHRFSGLRPRFADVPMIIFCICPFISSMANGLGAYDGASEILRQTVAWGLPYFIGRVFLGGPKAMEELALGIFVGGLLYVPFCLYEARFSPQLHRMVYGFFAHDDFSQTIRYGGYRPMVFMEHGLMVGMWMTSASLCGVWLFLSGVLQRYFQGKSAGLLGLQLVTMIMVKSTGAIGLFLIGTVALSFARFAKSGIVVLLLCSIPIAYFVARASAGWDGNNLIDTLASYNEDRAGSLRFRFDNEDMLIEKARIRQWLGWGGWGRSRIYNDEGEDITVTDGLWIIIYGKYGLLGLYAMTASLLLPVFLTLRRFPAKSWGTPRAAPSAVIAVLLTLYMVDNLLNAMINPMFILMAGALTSTALQPQQVDLQQEKPSPVTTAGSVALSRPRFL